MFVMSTQPQVFENVSVAAKANVYFDGKVVSHAVTFADGSQKTLGVIFPGSYHFGTEAAERMEIVAGSAKVSLDGSEETNIYGAGTAFEVPAKSGFSIEVEGEIAEYICSYIR